MNLMDTIPPLRRGRLGRSCGGNVIDRSEYVKVRLTRFLEQARAANGDGNNGNEGFDNSNAISEIINGKRLTERLTFGHIFR